MNAVTFIFKDGSLRLMIGPTYEAREARIDLRLLS